MPETVSADTIISTSWDDGHPLDSRLAELLMKYGLPATFYVPIENPERPLMTPAELRDLAAAGFEIGGHTYHHTRLLNVTAQAARQEIFGGKSALEDILGDAVVSFCYVGGQHSPQVAAMVREAGFLGARTTVRHQLWVPSRNANPYAMPTTLAARPFTRLEETTRWAGTREPGGLQAMLLGHTKDVLRTARRWLARATERGGVWHLWGHSWEIDRFGLWHDVEAVFKLMAETRASARWLTNGQVLCECAGAPMERPGIA
jgi:peptidoglycan/xylan/chitin deacetylase (PgdA/CDA1 family)